MLLVALHLPEDILELFHCVREEGEYQGAMTWAFIDAFEAFGRELSLGSLQDSMRAQLAANGYGQTPQLSLSRLFSPHCSLAAFGF